MTLAAIPRKATRILNFFLAGLVLIFLRAWIATSVDYEKHLNQALKSMRRTVVERVERGTIRDRFNQPLANNQTQYNAAIVYADIRKIPSVCYDRDCKGKRIKTFKRRNYIQQLAAFLAEQLEMDPIDIKDAINGKACLFPHTPCVLKEDISESLFLKLKGAQKDWVGIEMEQTTKRVYPEGKLACDVVGYVGAISDREYWAISEEISMLKRYLEEHEAGQPALLPKGFCSVDAVKGRLQELTLRFYTINDVVGKTGIEAVFDEALRGEVGKSIYSVDISGNLVSKLPESTPPKSGERLILTLSAELQQEAEALLAEYEGIQDRRDSSSAKKRSPPWQRGGAIVALDPGTGEVLALASYPRFDPNDLVPAKTPERRMEKQAAIVKWLESLSYVGQIWDGKRPLERERWVNGHFVTESLPLTWELYLDTTLSKGSSAYACLKQIETLQQATTASFELEFERDTALVYDILEMVAPRALYSEELLASVGDLSLSEHRTFCQTAARHLAPLKEEVAKLFHSRDFRKWREEHFEGFLKKKRKIEKRNGRCARPYTDYLHKEEKAQFAAFWKEHKETFFLTYLLKEEGSAYDEQIHKLRCEREDCNLEILEATVVSLPPELRKDFLKTLRTFEQLDRPLTRKYPLLRSEGGAQKECHLAAGFYPRSGFGYGRSAAFRQATPQGSIFKVLTAYSGLMQQFEQGAKDLNPLTLIDDMQWTAKPGSNEQVLGRFLDGRVIKRLHGGGRLPRAYPNIGQIGVTQALERTSNIYFSLLASEILDTPGRLVRDALNFGLGNPTGIDLTGEYGGLLPNDLHHNKTGLYAFAIGQHSLVVTPLQTAMMMAAFANGGTLFKPQILKCRANDHEVSFEEPLIREQLDLPPQVQRMLLSGMYKVTSGEKGTARPALIRAPFHNPDALKAYKELHTEMAGKTGTAEILFKQTLDAESRAALEKDTWFGTIGYKKGQADIVVVVYNRLGTAGKQGAPIAAKLIKKWREIQEKHYSPKV